MKTKFGKELNVGDRYISQHGEITISELGSRVANGAWDEMQGSDLVVHGICNGSPVREIVIGDLPYQVT